MSTGLPSTFKHFPLSRALCIFSTVVPMLVSLMGMKYIFYYSYDPFISQYRQLWRMITVQLAYVNESQVFISVIVFYLLRDLERLFGTPKYLGVIMATYSYTLLLIALLASVKFYTGMQWLNSVSSGPTTVIFALLANYRDYIPVMYKFEIAITEERKITLTDHFLIYILCFHLSVSQGLGTLALALLGWILGDLISRGVIPGKHWRLPNRLNRLLNDRESTPVLIAEVEAAEEEAEQAATETRPLTSQFLDTFRR